MTSKQTAANAATGRPRPLLTAQFALLLITTALFGLSFSTYFLLPKFLAVQLHADAATIGSVTAISWLASVLVTPVVGIHVDRHGRKYFGCLGALIFAAASAGYLWVTEVGPLLWLLRLMQGMSFTLFIVAMSTLATDISPTERLGQAIGLFGAVMISTNALGPAVGEWGAHLFSWSVIFACTATAAAVSAFCALLIHDPHIVHSDDNTTGMLQVITRPGLRRILTVAVMVGWTFGAAFTFYQPWALLHGFTQVSTFMIAYSIFAMAARVGLGGLGDRIGRLRVAKATLALYVAAPFALIWLDVIGLFITGSMLGLAHGLFFPALNAVAVDYALLRERGKAMAAYHGAFNSGFCAGSFLLGYVAMTTSYPTIFAIAGVTCLGAFFLLMGTPKIPAVAESL